MPSGSAPGERRGGRGKGTPNKATEIKRMMADLLATPEGKEMLAAAMAQAQQAPRGTKKALDGLREMTMLASALVAMNQPNKQGDGTLVVADHDRLQNYLTIAMRGFADLARFESPTFKAIAVADVTPPGPLPAAANNNGRKVIDYAGLTDDELAREYAAKVSQARGG